MNNNITELVFIIDKSGSMCNLEKDTIGGFNSMIAKQKKQDGKCFVSTVLFNHETEVLHDRLPLGQVGKMTEDDYFTSGSTALIDAIGAAVHHIENIHKYAREEDVPGHTMFVITTDGMENASHRYTAEKVRAMIKKKKEENGWEFLFIGANIDAVSTAAFYGISEDRAVDYNADSKGTAILYETIEKTVKAVRSGKKLSSKWSKSINADYEERSVNR